MLALHFAPVGARSQTACRSVEKEPGLANTFFGSLSEFQKGSIDVIDGDPKHYCFSNVFEVASRSKPYERVAVGKNLKYVLEASRAEGDSPWYSASHDEAALCMDGEVEVHFVKPTAAAVPESKEGAVQLAAQPQGRPMGWVKLRRGHQALLPKNSAYQFRAVNPGVVMIQTIQGECTLERWTEICLK
jgi:hypothetical protein